MRAARFPQTRKGAVIVASCKPIKADDDNPPHERAKREYVDIAGSHDHFFCTDEYWNEKKVSLEFEVKSIGVVRKIGLAAAIAAPALGISATASQARQHGQ